jgi:hypothetical protein
MSEAGFAARFALASLATWRVSHLLASEDGPGDAVVRLRAQLGAGRAGGLMDCFQCLSIWVAAPMTRVVSRESKNVFPTWLALSGAACLLERLGSEPVVLEAVEPGKQGGESHGLLWPEADRIGAHAGAG